MPDEVTEPSISDLRAMLDPPASSAPETPAAETAKIVPASEPEVNAGATDRGADGKFKPGAKAAAAEDAETVPAGVQKRIDKAVKAQREAERRAEEFEQQLAERPASRPAETPAPAAAKIEDPYKPVSTDPKYTTYDEFIADLTLWTIKNERATDAKAENTRKGVEAEVARGLAWNERVEAIKLRPEFADIDDVLRAGSESGKIAISEAMHHTIFDHARGPEIAYFLAANPDEAARIAKLPPFAAASAIGELVAALPAIKPATEAAPAKPAAHKPLPKPPASAGGSHAPSAVDLNDENLSVADFARETRKRLKAA